MSRYRESQSLYCYPGTDVLKNKRDIRDAETLENYERPISTWRISQLLEQPIKGAFDLKHLQSIHKYLFDDIYAFAGELRTEDIGKDDFRFASCNYIEDEAENLFCKLKLENNLSGLSAAEFAERAAYYLAEINVLHPFREGNGRAQREFIRCLAYSNGYNLEWERTDPKELLQASIRSISDIAELTNQIYKCLVNKESDANLVLRYKRRSRRKR